MARSSNTYNDAVESYYQRNLALRPSQIAARSKFVSLLNPGAQILDLGCGPGIDAKWFSEQGFEVTGADEAQNMIAKARQVAPEAKFIVMDMRRLDSENEFDGVFFSAALHTVPKRDAPEVIARIRRALRQGGLLFLSFKEGEGEVLKFDPCDNVEKFSACYSREEMEKLLGGFETVASGSITGFTGREWKYLICKRS